MKSKMKSLLSFGLAGAIFVGGTVFFSFLQRIKAVEPIESSGQVTNANYLAPAATLPTLVICETFTEPQNTSKATLPSLVICESSTETQVTTKATLPSLVICESSTETQITPKETLPSLVICESSTETQVTLPTQIQPTIPVSPTTHPATPFALRLYEEIFQRTPDSEGLAYWVNGFTNGTITASQAAFSFFISQEMDNLNLSDREYIQRLYTVLLGRPADADGQAYWSNYLNNGVSRTGILRQLVGSSEFAGLCKSAGIELGQIPSAKDAKDANLQLTVFINRQYKELLGRNGDSEGLDFWADRILKGASMEDISKEFVFSKEFTDKNYSDVNFINILYRAFMGRESDAEGLSFWQTEINAGMSREDVFSKFAYSGEFAQIVKATGL